jgi:hypothetical protein
VREVAAHVGSMLHRFAEALGQDLGDTVTHDRSTYYRPFRDEVADMVPAESAAEAGSRNDDELVCWIRKGAEDAVRAARSTAPDKVTGTRRFPRRLTASDFAATRVLEAGVHTMDIAHATLKGERIHPAAASIAVGILRGLLGADLPASLGWDARTFILTGTGRRPLSETERHTLGPLADTFPLLS